MKERYHISGMTCSACSSHVEKAASKLDGVEKASVNLLTETMDITYDADKLQEGDIVQAVINAGYGAEKMSGEKRKAIPDSAESRGGTRNRAETGREALLRKAKEESLAMKRRLGISLLFLLPLMYVSMHHMFHSWTGIPAPAWVTDYLHGNENAVSHSGRCPHGNQAVHVGSQMEQRSEAIDEERVALIFTIGPIPGI